METINHVEKAICEFSQKDFLRAVLIRLYQSATPFDIFCNSAFQNVSEKEIEIVCTTADVQINYTCSVGYVRKETYLGEEEYYDSDHQKRKRIVEKTREVTDWSPYQGEAVANQINVFLRNAPVELELARAEEKVIAQSVEDLCFEECERASIQVENEVFTKAKQLSGEKCFADVKLPGEKQKDVHWTGNAEFTDSFGILTKEYTVKYTYENKEYCAASFGGKKPSVACQAPSNTKDEKQFSKSANKKLFPFILLEIACVIFGIVTSVIDISTWAISAVALAAICVGVLLVLIIIHMVLRSALKKKAETEWKNKKMNDLNYLLQKLGLSSYNGNEVSEMSFETHMLELAWEDTNKKI